MVHVFQFFGDKNRDDPEKKEARSVYSEATIFFFAAPLLERKDEFVADIASGNTKHLQSSVIATAARANGLCCSVSNSNGIRSIISMQASYPAR